MIRRTLPLLFVALAFSCKSPPSEKADPVVPEPVPAKSTESPASTADDDTTDAAEHEPAVWGDPDTPGRLVTGVDSAALKPGALPCSGLTSCPTRCQFALPPLAKWPPIAATDLNGDGHLDLVGLDDEEPAFCHSLGSGECIDVELDPAALEKSVDGLASRHPDRLFELAIAAGLFDGTGFEVDPGGSEVQHFAVDVDEDGRLDILTFDAYGFMTPHLRRGDRMKSRQKVEAASVRPNRDWLEVQQIGVGHLDDDEHLDVVVFGGVVDGQERGTWAEPETRLLLGDGEGGFEDATIPQIEAPALIADLDGDGRDDVAGEHDDTAIWHFGSDDVTEFPELGTPLAAGDFDGDGDVDLLVEDDDAVRVALASEGTWTLAPRHAIEDRPRPVALVGDFNDDDHLDFYSKHGLLVFGLGDGTFWAAREGKRPERPDPVEMPSANADFQPVGSVDLDSDGDSDIVAVRPDRAVVWWSNEETGPSGPRIVELETDREDLGPANDGAVGDFDGDGHGDVAVWFGGRKSVDGLAIFYGDGAGTFSPRVHTVDDVDWLRLKSHRDRPLVVADFDRDGADDLIVDFSAVEERKRADGDGMKSPEEQHRLRRRAAALSVLYWRGRPKGPGAPEGIYGARNGLRLEPEGSGDVDADGMPDVAARDEFWWRNACPEP